MKKIYIKIAGIINLLTALVHLLAGQIDLVNPLNSSSLELQQKAEWVGVWHLVTILLFYTSYLILKEGLTKANKTDLGQLKSLGVLYVLAGVPFMLSSVYFTVFAPQWVLLMPIGILVLLGLKNRTKGLGKGH